MGRHPSATMPDSHPFARPTGDEAVTERLVDQFINTTRTRDLTPMFRPFGETAKQLQTFFQEAIDYGRQTAPGNDTERGGNDGIGTGERPDIAAAFKGNARAEAAAKEFEALDAAETYTAKIRRRQVRPARTQPYKSRRARKQGS